MAPKRGAGLSTQSFYCISRRSLNICRRLFLEALNFVQAIEITSGKAFRLFSEYRKIFILFNAPLSIQAPLCKEMGL